MRIELLKINSVTVAHGDKASAQIGRPLDHRVDGRAARGNGNEHPGLDTECLHVFWMHERGVMGPFADQFRLVSSQ